MMYLLYILLIISRRRLCLPACKNPFVISAKEGAGLSVSKHHGSATCFH
jgi:hypothetical protein